MSYYWRVRKPRNELTFIVSMYLLGLAVLFSLMVYITSAGR